MKEYNRLKPGQLCTVGNHVYRATKRPDNYFPVCAHCRRTNEDKLLCKRNGDMRVLKCWMLFGANYPKLVK